MKRFYAIMYNGHVPAELLTFPLVEEGANDYTAIGSYNAFQAVQGKICQRGVKADTRWCYVMREHEYVMHLEAEKRAAARMGTEFQERVAEEVKDLWTFYKRVGYDYKSKRFTGIL